MVNKLRLIFLFMLLIPQGVMFAMAYDSLLATNKTFGQIEAASLASGLLLVMIMPSATVKWLVGKHLDSMRKLCYEVKQGNYLELLPLSNEARDDEDDIIILKRDMNWMARQIEIRERDLRRAADELWQSHNNIDEQNKILLAVNTELLLAQESLKERTIQLEESCRCMKVMAMTDSLTAIANRRCFFETMERQFANLGCNYKPISLLIIDIDYFKKINDTYGHQAGDQVLLELAKIIQENARGGDLVARIGGEEYGVLLPGALAEQAACVAKRIKTGTAKHRFILGGDEVRITVSIGICTLSQSLCCFDREKIYNYADQALYYSKNNGRNSISVYNSNTDVIAKVS